MRQYTRAASMALALLIAGSGCSKTAGNNGGYSSTPDDERAATGSVLYGDQLTRVLQMHESYLTLITARDAVANGETDIGRELLTEVATQPMPEGISAIWAPEVLNLHAAAGRGARAEQPEGVAQGIAEAAKSCGSCHTATGYLPQLAGQMAPPSPDTPSSLMKRHAWAAQQLWDGLIIPSEDRWNEGAKVLAESNVSPTNLFTNEYVAEVGAARVHGLQAATRKVVAADAWDQRAEAYGELLHTCASCHGN